MKKRMIIMGVATAEAVSKLSYAKRNKVGAVIFKDDRIISTGFNGMPRGSSSHKCEDTDNKTKSDVIHAEANALDNLLRGGSSESTIGASIIVTLSPCVDCALRIANVGISSVYYTTSYRDCSGIELLETMGVYVEQVNESSVDA